MQLHDRDLAEHATRLEALLEDVESFPEAETRAKMAAIVQGLVAFYGEGLTRMLAIVQQQDDAAAADRVVDAFAGDELVSHLLLLHDLHPIPVETRVARALEEVRPYLQSHGGNVELLGIADGVVRLRLQGSCQGCPSSTVTLKMAIEEAIRKAAPELEGIEAEGAVEPPRSPAFVPATAVRRYSHCPAAGEEVGAHADTPGALHTNGVGTHGGAPVRMMGRRDG